MLDEPAVWKPYLLFRYVPQLDQAYSDSLLGTRTRGGKKGRGSSGRTYGGEVYLNTNKTTMQSRWVHPVVAPIRPDERAAPTEHAVTPRRHT